MTSNPLVVVGGGPAGMAAALEAARTGLPCTLIDEAPQLGGQIYRRPPTPFDVPDAQAFGPDFVRGEQLREEVAKVADHVDVRSGTVVLGIWRGRTVLWASGDTARLLHANRLILAPGAYDRPVPFPGWTLPGVMTAGGVQVLLKTMRVRPGRRALVAGTGPLILSVASRLQAIGLDVVAVLEAGAPWSPEGWVQAWGEWDFITSTEKAWQALRHAEIPLLFHHTIFEAHGHGQVEAASYGPVDPVSWKPRKEQARTVEVDLVVVGFGFVPNTELTVLAGCQHQYVQKLGGWIPVRDPLMQTTVPGVFVVGDGAGVRGAAAAIEEGRVAGITAAEQAGAMTRREADLRREAPVGRLRELTPILEVLHESSWVRPGLLELAGPDTLLCRCEEVTRAEVQAAIEEGARDLQAVKLLTRLGMGPCQGRQCAPSTGMYVCEATRRPPEQVGRINPRPPVKPVTLGALAQVEAVHEAAVSDSLDALGGLR